MSKEEITVHDLSEIIKHQQFTIDEDKENNYWINIKRFIKELNKQND